MDSNVWIQLWSAKENLFVKSKCIVKQSLRSKNFDFCSRSDIEHCGEENWRTYAFHPEILSPVFITPCEQVHDARYQNYDSFWESRNIVNHFLCLNRIDKYPMMFDFQSPPINDRGGKGVFNNFLIQLLENENFKKKHRSSFHPQRVVQVQPPFWDVRYLWANQVFIH